MMEVDNLLSPTAPRITWTVSLFYISDKQLDQEKKSNEYDM